MADLMKRSDISAGTNFKFPVHRLYTKFQPQWLRVRDCLEGQDTIKAKGVTYLPKLSGQSTEEYEAYKYRAVFFGISSRLLNTNVGVIVRRTPTVKYSEAMEPYFTIDNINVLSFDELRRIITRELGSVSRVATLIDVNNDMPIPKVINTEAIINWSENDQTGEIISILLATDVITTDPDTFTETANTVYYKLHLAPWTEDANKMVYTVTNMDANKDEIGSVQPALRGVPLTYIPFFCVNPFGVNINPVKATMVDIVDINLSHYLTSADLENGRHFVGLPTPWVTGGTAETKLRVGSETAWIIPNDKAKVGFLEFLGQGLDSLSKALQEKQGQMSQFSAQLMDTSTRGSEAEGTVRLRYSSDAANLTDIAISTESCLKLTYNAIADWLGEVRPEIELNKDFLSTKMSHNELIALTNSLVEGSITEEVFFYNLERGEMMPNDADKAAFVKAIKDKQAKIKAAEVKIKFNNDNNDDENDDVEE